MSMLTYGNLQGISNAIQLKGALIEASHRANPQFPAQPRTAAGMLGLALGSAESAMLQLPVLDQEGKVFAMNLIGSSSHIPVVSGNVTEGTLIQYDGGSETQYGLVVEPPIFRAQQGVYVQELTKQQVQELTARNQLKSKVVIKENDLKHLEVRKASSTTRLPHFLSFINPFQRAFWQALKESFHLGFDYRRLLVDMVLWIYIILIVIVLAVLLVVNRIKI